VSVEGISINPFWIPIVGMIAGTLMVVAIVGIVSWRKTREKELQYHQDLRIREMEHQRKMKELEVELEKARAMQTTGKAAS
jgi:predicted histidine transporter YuiF (NhaC family)